MNHSSMATLIATLAEKINHTSLKPFQKTAIDATLNGQDTLVICIAYLEWQKYLLPISTSLSQPQPLLSHLPLATEMCNKKEVFNRSAPCLGVKYCPEKECNHIVPIREKRVCPKHSSVLEKT